MSKPKDHRCECPKRPRCVDHIAEEWGGGWPDECASHAHIPRRLMKSYRGMAFVPAGSDPLAEGNQDAGGIPRGPWDAGSER